jgi:hypothetical protein
MTQLQLPVAPHDENVVKSRHVAPVQQGLVAEQV